MDRYLDALEWCEETYNSCNVEQWYPTHVGLDVVPVDGSRISARYWLEFTGSLPGADDLEQFLPQHELANSTSPAILTRVRCVRCLGKIVVENRVEARRYLRSQIDEIFCKKCEVFRPRKRDIERKRQDHQRLAELLKRYTPFDDYLGSTWARSNRREASER